MNTPDTENMCKTSPHCSHNTNGRSLDKPCSIRFTTPDTEWESFEKYLEHVCFEANPTVLDDDMPDFFDGWLGLQNGEDYIRLADEYATSRDTYWKERVRKELGEINFLEGIVGHNNRDIVLENYRKLRDTLLDNLK